MNCLNMSGQKFWFLQTQFSTSAFQATHMNFKKSFLKSFPKYNLTIIIPQKYFPIFTHNLPELAAHTIGIPYRDDVEINLDLKQNFCLKTTDNILTFLMIPIASSLGEKVFLLGCDGRPIEENSYFWNHSPGSQFVDQMKSIRKAHPSFFKYDYAQYYRRHCATVENYCTLGEHHGISYQSLSSSHIPAMEDRKHPYAFLKNENLQNLIVSINPDVTDSYGHYFSYDLRIGECLVENEELVTLGPKNCKISFPKSHIRSVFGSKTWSLRSGRDPDLFEEFILQLGHELDFLNKMSCSKKAYMYTGDIRHGWAILKILLEKKLPKFFFLLKSVLRTP